MLKYSVWPPFLCPQVDALATAVSSGTLASAVGIEVTGLSIISTSASLPDGEHRGWQPFFTFAYVFLHHGWPAVKMKQSTRSVATMLAISAWQCCKHMQRAYAL